MQVFVSKFSNQPGVTLTVGLTCVFVLFVKHMICGAYIPVYYKLINKYYVIVQGYKYKFKLDQILLY